MSFLQRLFGGRFTAPPPEETNLSTDEIMRELHPPPSRQQKQALKLFAEHLLAQVPEEERSRLVRRIMRKFVGVSDASSALSDGLLDDQRGQKLEYLVLLQIDTKGFDAFEYQVPYLLNAGGVSVPYPHLYDRSLLPSTELLRFAEWLRAFDKCYLNLDSQSDSHHGFIVDADMAEEMIKLGTAAGLAVRFEHF